LQTVAPPTALSPQKSRDEGEPVKTIAETLKVSAATVYRIVAAD
jgi:hypothetical protein